jgi:hypothetical protein
MNGPADTCTLEVSLVVTVMVVWTGAGAGSETPNVTDCPSETAVVVGTRSAPALCTVTLAVASGMLGKALAWTIAFPNAAPVTGTLTVVAPWMNVALAGTVAIAVLLDERLTVTPPAGAAAERVRIRFWVTNPEMVREDGVKFTVALTCTVALAVVIPVPDAVMLDDPMFTPVIVGWVDGVVWPERMVTDAGETVTFVGSWLRSPMVRLAGAVLARVMGNATDAPRPTVGLDGKFTVTGAETVTLAVASGIFGRLLAWITVEPAATGVTRTVAVVCPELNVAVPGTVATPGVLDVTFTVMPLAGAGADKVKVRFCGAVPTMVRADGLNVTVEFTCTPAMACVYPVAVAVMFALPMLTPVIVGWVVGADWPAAMLTVGGEIVTLLASLLCRVTVRAVGAGVPRVTENIAVPPKFTAALDGSVMVPGDVTVTVAVASAIFGKLPAWITVVPGVTGVTVTVVVVCPEPNVAVAGTVATPGALDERLTEMPVAGAGADRVKVRFCAVVPTMVRVGGVNATVAFTCTPAVDCV